MKRVSINELNVGDIVGIEYASNTTIRSDEETWLKSLGKYEVIEEKRCLCLRPIVSNWFLSFTCTKPVCEFGDNMFVRLEV